MLNLYFLHILFIDLFIYFCMYCYLLLRNIIILSDLKCFKNKFQLIIKIFDLLKLKLLLIFS